MLPAKAGGGVIEGHGRKEQSCYNMASFRCVWSYTLQLQFIYFAVDHLALALRQQLR